MARRLMLRLVAAGEEDAPGAPAPAPAADPAAPPAAAPAATGQLPSPNGRFHTLIILTNTWTTDGRLFESLDWRDLPLPFMAEDWTDVEHMNAVLIGNIDTVELRGDEVHGWGAYLAEPGPEAARLIDLVKRNELRGVSADVEPIEYELLWPVNEQAAEDMAEAIIETGDPFAMPPLPREEIDGQVFEVMAIEDPKLRVTLGRLMGATVVPFPAFEGAFVEDDTGQLALTAAGVGALSRGKVTGAILAAADVATRPTITVRENPVELARFTVPEYPPIAWFERPEPPGPMPLTIMDNGEVFGHLAIWGECHIGFPDECVTPPSSPSNYSRFHVGELAVEGGAGRLAVGRLTYATGHAARHLGYQPAARHYDDTGSVGAYIRAMDGEHGIWCCGSLKHGMTAAGVAELMANPPSGDWRSFGGDLEMVAALCVPVPGFNTPRSLTASGWAQVSRDDGLTTSLIVSHPAPALTASAAARYLGEMDDDTAVWLMELVAEKHGRSTRQQMAALHASVHR